MPSASIVFLQHLVGELETPNLRKFSQVGEVYMYTMLLHGASNLDQRLLKTRHSAQGCTFWGCERFRKIYGVKPPKLKMLGP